MLHVKILQTDELRVLSGQSGVSDATSYRRTKSYKTFKNVFFQKPKNLYLSSTARNTNRYSPTQPNDRTGRIR